MELRLQLNDAFKDRFCTIDWIEKDIKREWRYCIETFYLETKKVKLGSEVVDDIFKSNPILIKKKFILSLRKVIQEEVKYPIYVLYYHYE